MIQLQSVDIAILGGGLAGLSLAVELSDQAFAHLTIVVLEPRESYRRDKTWSYWRQAPHDFSDCEVASWHAWRIANAQDSVIVKSDHAENYRYASIASDAFYLSALAKIKACKHIHLLQNELVESLRTEANMAIIALKSAKNIIVKQAIFDSRPPQSASNNPIGPHLNLNQHLTQHFLGLELQADSAIFDTNYVDLMDFQVNDHGIHFMYVLPYTSTHALIESTWICSHPHHNDYITEIQKYLAKRWPNAKFDIAYTETGRLPLVAEKAQSYRLGKTQVVPIGSRAGTARAATGYAFLETLSDNKRLANLLKTNQTLSAFKRNT